MVLVFERRVDVFRWLAKLACTSPNIRIQDENRSGNLQPYCYGMFEFYKSKKWIHPLHHSSGLVLVTIAIGDACHMPATCSRFGSALALYGIFFSFLFIRSLFFICICRRLADLAWFKTRRDGFFYRQLFRNIFHHPAGGEVIFFAARCFIYRLG